MNENVKIDGEVDAGWTSYYDPTKHGNMSETIDGTTEDDMHSETTTAIPSHVDRDELTKTQQRAVEAYFTHPTATQNELSDMTDISRTTIRKALENADIEPNWIERLEERDMGQYAKSAQTKMESTKPTGEDIVDNIKSNIEPQNDAEAGESIDGMESLQTALNAIEATAQTEETQQAVEHIRGLL